MLPVILVYKRTALELTLTQVGLIAGVYYFSVSLTQPLFGHLSDRWGERPFAAGALLWVSLLGASLGFTPSFGLLFIAVALQALGPAIFHPPGASGAGRLPVGKRGFSMSFFLSGGSLGSAIGPLIAAAVFEVSGLRGTAWIGLFALFTALILGSLLWWSWPTRGVHRESTRIQAGEVRLVNRVPRAMWLAGIALLTVTAVRTGIHMSLATYVPQYLTELGYTPAQASRWLSVMLAGVMIGVLSGGPLSDRFGPQRVIFAALGILGGVILLLVQGRLVSPAVLIPLAGIAVGIPLSMTIVIGQSFLKEGTGFASGLILGMSFVAGAAGVTLTGAAADRWGLTPALIFLGVLSLTASLAAFALPKKIPERNR